MINERLGFYEFFAGGGMARLGLGREWRCLMANDICRKKGQAYRTNFPPANELILEDVYNLTLAKLPDKPRTPGLHFPVKTFP